MLTIRKRLYDQSGSLIVILPKIWTDAKGLKPRDMVEIQLNDKLTIVPVKAGDKAK